MVRRIVCKKDVCKYVTITVSAARIWACGGRCVGWVRHWYSVARVRESNGQVSVHLDCNDR